MKKSARHCLALLFALNSVQAKALDISTSIDAVGTAYADLEKAIEENKEAVLAELMVKEGLLKAIEAELYIAEAIGVASLEGNQRALVVPAAIGTTMMTFYGSRYLDRAAKLLPEEQLSAWKSQYRLLKAAEVRASREFAKAQRLAGAVDDLAQAVANAAGDPARAEVLSGRLSAAQEAADRLASLESAKMEAVGRTATHLKVKPGMMHRGFRLIRRAARGSIVLGALGLYVTTGAQVGVVLLPEKVDDLVDSLQADILKLETLLSEAGAFDPSEEG